MEIKSIRVKVSKEEVLKIMSNHRNVYKKRFYESPIVELFDKESGTVFRTTETDIINSHEGDIFIEMDCEVPEFEVMLPCYLTREEMTTVSLLLGRNIGEINSEK